MDYKDQIKTPLWQKRRLEIMKLHNFKCQICNCDNRELHIHHKKYKKNKLIHEYSDSELMCLCSWCHGKIHNKFYDKYTPPIKIGWFVFEEECFKNATSLFIDYFVELLQKSLKSYMLENVDCIIQLNDNDTFIFPVIDSNKSFALHIDYIDFNMKEIIVKNIYTFD